MEITCRSCGGEELIRDPDAPKSADIPLLCTECGWRGRRTPKTSCPRCASAEVDETPVDGWAYGDLDQARENPGTPDWGYVDKTIYRCQKCRNEWSKAGEYRPYVEPVPPTDTEAVWRRIHNLAGQEFFTKSGQRFSYEATQRAIDLNNTNRMIPRSDFEKALERMPVAGPGQLQDLQGPSYIYGILTDPRIAGDAGGS